MEVLSAEKRCRASLGGQLTETVPT